MGDRDRASAGGLGVFNVRGVLAWLDAVGNVAEAATRLGVHTNTLRYRLRRTAELFDISLDDPDDRLSLWLQLRLIHR
ncbi:helix-turn-helix domain-containing protein [Streptomyces sp. CA-210063]|uniref:helix-turn-helix domain-containing protein n=1 Tax=Streptomyces sp. CA-210063 TaxID=2801029 RepID=UPI00214CC1E3|nr:helix-turn-helix domain-containing protein [Streptomyces sp. CA-210063]UUU31885.1 helix-turn-helix domain-containing protein [Streptomyces sp. CA-210063]